MRKGFTLIEAIVTLTIVAVLAAVAVVNLFGARNKAALDSATKQIGTLLREAQSDSMVQSRGVSWGVHFANATATAPFYALFASSTYDTSVIVGYYRLPASVLYATSTLASGATLDITFSQIAGLASASASIILYMPAAPSLSSTISISSSGAVNY